jgi:hypothetical protein
MPLTVPLAAAPYRASGLVPWHLADMPEPGWKVRFWRAKLKLTNCGPPTPIYEYTPKPDVVLTSHNAR